MRKRIFILIVVIVIICAGIGLYKINAHIDQNLSNLTQMKIDDIDLLKISDGISSHHDIATLSGLFAQTAATQLIPFHRTEYLPSFEAESDSLD